MEKADFIEILIEMKIAELYAIRSAYTAEHIERIKKINLLKLTLYHFADNYSHYKNYIGERLAQFDKEL